MVRTVPTRTAFQTVRGRKEWATLVLPLPIPAASPDLGTHLFHRGHLVSLCVFYATLAYNHLDRLIKARKMRCEWRSVSFTRNLFDFGLLLWYCRLLYQKIHTRAQNKALLPYTLSCRMLLVGGRRSIQPPAFDRAPQAYLIHCDLGTQDFAS